MAKRDINQLAKLIFNISTGEIKDTNITNKLPIEKVKGRSGGLIGGKARANSLTADQRSKIARKAAESRWKNKS